MPGTCEDRNEDLLRLRSAPRYLGIAEYGRDAKRLGSVVLLSFYFGVGSNLFEMCLIGSTAQVNRSSERVSGSDLT